MGVLPAAVLKGSLSTVGGRAGKVHGLSEMLWGRGYCSAVKYMKYIKTIVKGKDLWI